MVTEKSCIYQNNEYTCLKNKKVEPVTLVQMNIYQSNAHRENLSWRHFDEEPRVHERKKVKDQQSCISVLWLVKQYQVVGLYKKCLMLQITTVNNKVKI